MKNVTIRRCATCQNIGGHTDQVTAALKNDSDVKVNIVDGAKGEFSVEVDGRKINAKEGESLRDASDLATEIRGASAATAV